ncbi:Oligopeptide transporter 5 [Platanthera guangdongensis]|uniref:Oligopeptide transporter 5 n=1 Tax=Platanthera guangdongensis TaxID=2320717 RepID=A0ABR2LFD0_9ASPA
MQQVGSALPGLGIVAFAVDWSAVAGFLGSPLATPGFAIINVMFGFIMVVEQCVSCQELPIFSSNVYMGNGTLYNVNQILNQKTFSLNQEKYDEAGPINLSIFFVITYGLSFATLAATLSHVSLFHGRNCREIWSQTRETMQDKFRDVHTRLMKKNCPQVPQWWFYSILFLMIGLTILAVEGSGSRCSFLTGSFSFLHEIMFFLISYECML